MTVFTAKDRASLITREWEYKKRMNIMKKKKNNIDEIPKRKEFYKKSYKKNQSRVKVTRASIKNLDIRTNKIIALGNHVAYFTSYNIKGIGRDGIGGNGGIDKKKIQAKGLFCKWGMENGIPGVSLSEYMGCDGKTASRNRLRFTKSFSVNRENREMWNRFKLYYADILSDLKKNSEKDLVD